MLAHPNLNGSSTPVQLATPSQEDSLRVIWPDRFVELFYDLMLVGVVTWGSRQWLGSLSAIPVPFDIGPVRLESVGVAWVIGFQMLLLLTRRQTFGMMLINAHVVDVKRGVKASALRAALPRLLVYALYLGVFPVGEYGAAHHFAVLLWADVLWLFVDPAKRVLHNRLCGTEIWHRS